MDMHHIWDGVKVAGNDSTVLFDFVPRLSPVTLESGYEIKYCTNQLGCTLAVVIPTMIRKKRCICATYVACAACQGNWIR